MIKQKWCGANVNQGSVPRKEWGWGQNCTEKQVKLWCKSLSQSKRRNASQNPPTLNQHGWNFACVPQLSHHRTLLRVADLCRAALKAITAEECLLTTPSAAGLFLVKHCPQAGTSALPWVGHLNALSGWHLLRGATCGVTSGFHSHTPTFKPPCCKVSPLAT